MTLMRAFRATALAAALAVACAGCGGGSNAAKTRPQPTIGPPSTTPDPDAVNRAAVQAAFDEYRRFYVQVIADPDPSNPALAAHLTGDALGAMQRDQAGFQSTHEGKRLTEVSDRSAIVSIDSVAGRAVVDECVAAIAHYFDTRTNQPMGATPASAPTSEGFEFVLVKDGATWKVSEKHSKASACQQG